MWEHWIAKHKYKLNFIQTLKREKHPQTHEIAENNNIIPSH